MRWMIPQNHLHQFQIQLITAEDVEKVLKVLKVKKETGVDFIPSRLLKVGANIVVPPLANIRQNYPYL